MSPQLRFEIWHRATFGYAYPPSSQSTESSTVYLDRQQNQRWIAYQAAVKHAIEDQQQGAK